MENHQPSRTIPWFLIIVFLLLVAGILITGFLFYHTQQQRIKSEAQNDLAAIADLKVGQITDGDKNAWAMPRWYITTHL